MSRGQATAAGGERMLAASRERPPGKRGGRRGGGGGGGGGAERPGRPAAPRPRPRPSALWHSCSCCSDLLSLLLLLLLLAGEARLLPPLPRALLLHAARGPRVPGREEGEHQHLRLLRLLRLRLLQNSPAVASLAQAAVRGQAMQRQGVHVAGQGGH